jgi:hypothetical protein
MGVPRLTLINRCQGIKHNYSLSQPQFHPYSTLSHPQSRIIPAYFSALGLRPMPPHLLLIRILACRYISRTAVTWVVHAQKGGGFNCTPTSRPSFADQEGGYSVTDALGCTKLSRYGCIYPLTPTDILGRHSRESKRAP